MQLLFCSFISAFFASSIGKTSVAVQAVIKANPSWFVMCLYYITWLSLFVAMQSPPTTYHICLFHITTLPIMIAVVTVVLSDVQKTLLSQYRVN